MQNNKKQYPDAEKKSDLGNLDVKVYTSLIILNCLKENGSPDLFVIYPNKALKKKMKKKKKKIYKWRELNASLLKTFTFSA